MLPMLRIRGKIGSIDEHFVTREEGPHFIRADRNEISAVHHLLITSQDLLPDLLELASQVLDILTDGPGGAGESLSGMSIATGMRGIRASSATNGASPVVAWTALL